MALIPGIQDDRVRNPKGELCELKQGYQALAGCIYNPEGHLAEYHQTSPRENHNNKIKNETRIVALNGLQHGVRSEPAPLSASPTLPGPGRSSAKI